MAVGLSLPIVAMGQSGASVVGEVKKVDVNGGKLTLKHDEIPSLDMPAMTMVFSVNSGSLSSIKVGDKVRFRASKTDGRYIATDIQPAQ